MLKVVLVDDEYYFRMSLKKNMPWEENGFAVVGDANNGHAAFALIKECRPDIAIIDINMPGYNGIELIEKLREEDIDCEYVLLTGYDEFRYAQKAIRLGVSDYALKPLDYDAFLESLRGIREKIEKRRGIASRLSALEKKNAEYRRNSYYNDLINCSLSQQNMRLYDEELAESLYLDYRGYAVAVFECLGQQGRNVLLQHARHIAERFGAHRFICCIDRKNCLLCIAEANEGFTLLAQGIKDYLVAQEGPVIAGIGKRYEDFSSIYLSYNEARLAMKSNLLRTDSLLRYDDMEMDPLAFVLNDRIKNRLKSQTLRCAVDEAQKTICAAYEEMIAQKAPYTVVVLHTLELLSLLIELLSAELSQPVSLPGMEGNVLDTLEECHDIYEIMRWLCGLYAAGIQRIRGSKGSGGTVTQLVQDYIEKNFADSSLSVQSISRNLFLNYSYICYCFKRDKRMTVNEYINRLRISAAMDLFAAQSSSISYVSQRVGYENPGYFSRRFKKATGLSPSDYIKNLS